MLSINKSVTYTKSVRLNILRAIRVSAIRVSAIRPKCSCLNFPWQFRADQFQIIGMVTSWTGSCCSSKSSWHCLPLCSHVILVILVHSSLQVRWSSFIKSCDLHVYLLIYKLTVKALYFLVSPFLFGPVWTDFCHDIIYSWYEYVLFYWYAYYYYLLIILIVNKDFIHDHFEQGHIYCSTCGVDLCLTTWWSTMDLACYMQFVFNH